MAVQNQDQKFFEVIKPGSNYEFIGRTKYWIGLSIVLTIVSILMIFLNAYVIKSRGHFLNWGVDFRGGSEILIEFSRAVDAADIRKALASSGFHDADVVKYEDPTGQKKWNYLLRVGAVSVVSEQQAKQIKESLAKVGEASLKRFEWSEGGDKIYLRYDKTVEPSVLSNSLKAIGVNTTQVQGFGRADDNTYEVTLVGLDTEIRRGLDAALGAGAVGAIPKVDSVGAKAGNQLKADGAKSLLYAILLIMVYVAFRFDLRYGPGTVIALLHDAVITIGAFAVTYKEFSLTTVAAVLTIIGFSMNDTIVVFDRIRENAARLRDRRFDRVVNQSINETLSRTILTSATVFFVTLAMNILGVGVIRDFAFAMNVGVIVGTYSSIFIASPVLIWLNDKYTANQRKQQGRQGRRPQRGDDDTENL
jgi:preprotein translocase subunit SecF